MATRKWPAVAVAVVLAGLSTPAPIRAHETATDTDRTMCIAFTRPVALPGVALGSGSYIFELADPLGAWNLVRVSSHDRRRVYLTAYTRIVDRPIGMSPEQTISFGEAPDNAALPITAWWPIGETTGRQFIY